jgi:hypothetical protein
MRPSRFIAVMLSKKPVLVLLLSMIFLSAIADPGISLTDVRV